jgi:hypothetical protein
VTEDLRALLRADLSAERPPPLGDVVGTAIREGRRIRRKRRLGSLMAGCAVIAAFASGVIIVGDGTVADGHGLSAAAPADLAASPQTVPPAAAAPMAVPRGRTLTIHSGTVRVDGLREKATSAAMLHLLTQLLPPGRTSHYGTVGDNDLRVQLYLDDGTGPAMVRLGIESPDEIAAAAAGKPTMADSRSYAPLGDETARGVPVKVTIQHMPDNCLQNTVVEAAWPDGVLISVDIATCLPLAGGRTGPPSRAALTIDEAVRVAVDPRWGPTMAADLVKGGAKQFPRVPVLS